MRLDKFLCDALGTTRKEATQLLKSGEVTVDDVVQKVVHSNSKRRRALSGKAVKLRCMVRVTS